MKVKKEKKSLSAWNVKESRFPKNGRMESKIKFLVRYAILAPSGHNSQPWIFTINNQDLTISPDLIRKRKVVDPDNREMYISLGSAAKNLEVAANYFGLMFEKTIKNDTIVFKFFEGKKISSHKNLFEAITNRNTNREEFLEKGIDKEILEQLNETKGENSWIKLIHNHQEKKELANLIHDADLVWYKSRDLLDELEGWLRDDLSTKGDGIPTGMLNLYKMATEVKYLFSADNKTARKRAEKDRKEVLATPVLAAIISKDDTTPSWIEAGETYQLLALKLTSLGLENGFFNTVVELNGQRTKLENTFRIKGKVQMVLRIGYVDQRAKHTPRRLLEDVLVTEN